MNQQIKLLMGQSLDEKFAGTWSVMDLQDLEKFADRFAELIVTECDRLNRTQAHELAGVVADTEQGDGFDDVCLDTVKRVESYLGSSTLKKHFGIEP